MKLEKSTLWTQCEPNDIGRCNKKRLFYWPDGGTCVISYQALEKSQANMGTHQLYSNQKDGLTWVIFHFLFLTTWISRDHLLRDRPHMTSARFQYFLTPSHLFAVMGMSCVNGALSNQEGVLILTEGFKLWRSYGLMLHSSPHVRSAFCPMKIDHKSELTLYRVTG